MGVYFKKMTETRIFMISGLGADGRAFQLLRLNYTSTITYIDWIKPDKEDTLTSYAQKLIDHYQIDSNSVLIGLSMGGMVSIEIAKMVQPLKTIIISSVRNKNELPLFQKIFGLLGLHRFIPESKLSKSNFILERRFGAQNQFEKEQLREALKRTNPSFAKWAIGAITQWDEKAANEHIIKIHGDKDRLLPLRGKADYILKDAGHMMIIQRALEISDILDKELEKVFSETAE